MLRHGDVAGSVVLIDNGIQIVARHSAFAFTTLEVEEKGRGRREGAIALLGQRTLQLAQGVVLGRALVLTERFQSIELLVAGIAVEIGLFKLFKLLSCHIAEEFLVRCCSGYAAVASAVQVVFEGLIGTEASLTICAFKCADVGDRASVDSDIVLRHEKLVVLGTVVVFGGLPMSNAVLFNVENLVASWTGIMLLRDVLLKRAKIIELPVAEDALDWSIFMDQVLLLMLELDVI